MPLLFRPDNDFRTRFLLNKFALGTISLLKSIKRFFKKACRYKLLELECNKTIAGRTQSN